jgi:hypothetical protein
LFLNVSFSSLYIILLKKLKAQADAVVDTILDLVNFYYSKVFPIEDEAEKVNKLFQGLIFKCFIL